MLTRAAAAILWAIALFAALHGQRVLTGSDVPVGVGLLLAAYPLIDAGASLWDRRGEAPRQLPVSAVIDGLAVVALLVATLALHTGSVLIAFGAWAIVSGLLQLVHARRTQRSRRGQLPLAISGTVSAIAGISFAAQAAHDTAQLANLGGYAVLGAAFFLIWVFLDRSNQPSPSLSAG